ncbi:MAG: ABC transporter substrate-binding protein [Holosporaceae bacterium]|jgi:putrescine transport system substrate-binding protein|nr:ABC transporter substrate-binding protein [Holosporaceae bacterium]
MRFFLALSICLSLLFVFKDFRKAPREVSKLEEVLLKEDFGPFDEDKSLYIILGIDYIPYELINLFENITGIKVIVDIFDSNEILEAKLLTGEVGYDIVFPTAWPNFSRQLKVGIYQKLDKKRIDMSIFDRDILEKLMQCDANNDYAIPFQFGISGIGIDEKIVNKVLGNSCKKDTLSIVFDPENAAKLSQYRISLCESQSEIFPAVLAYLGLNPESENEEDIIKAADHLKKIRSSIAKFTSFGFEDLASKNACVVLGTSGDILKVQRDNNPCVKFFSPVEGASLWIDVAAIPVKAKHLNNIYAFLKFLFHPMVIAEITNTTFRANAVQKSAKYLRKDIVDNADIYPSNKIRQKCYIEKPLSPKLERIKTRLLTQIKSNA